MGMWLTHFPLGLHEKEGASKGSFLFCNPVIILSLYVKES